MSDQQSDVTPRLSPRKKMTLVTEREVEDAPRPNLTMTSVTSSNLSAQTPNQMSPTTNQVEELLSRAAWRAGVIASLTVITRILAVRLILLVAVLGSIALAFVVLNSSDVFHLVALGTYCAVVVVPIVLLSARQQ